MGIEKKRSISFVCFLPPGMFVLFPNHQLKSCAWWLEWYFGSKMPIFHGLTQVALLQEALTNRFDPQSSSRHWLPSCRSSRAVHSYVSCCRRAQLVYVLSGLRLSWDAGGGVRKSPASRWSILYPQTHTHPLGNSHPFLTHLPSEVPGQDWTPAPKTLSSWKLYCSDENLPQLIFPCLCIQSLYSLRYLGLRALKKFSSSI